MSDATKAVFLSYAREDTAAAQRIAEALRSHGVEVWFDQNELRGGDAWDAKIRQQIKTCALFLPVISAHTQERNKGYFRLEWKLAVEQTHLMREGVPFLVPVVIDSTPENDSAVPEPFTRVQWTRLPGALPSPQFVEQVKRLLYTSVAPDVTAPPFSMQFAPAATPVAYPASVAPATAMPLRRGFPLWAIAAVVLFAVGAVTLLVMKRDANPTPSATAVKAPDKSIAVLPFVNMSAEKESEFFADGMHDEVITALAKIHDLKVISRTSVMVYRTGDRNLKKIAAELGVANVLEGSVQRSGNQVKVIVQLIDARTDQHLWAETYIEDLTDVFTIQAKLTGAITTALKAALSPEEKSLIARRPTQNPAAYELYLRATVAEENITSRSSFEEFEQVATLYQQTIALDPEFALAYARLAHVHGLMYWYGNIDPTPKRRELVLDATAAAQRLAPDAPETHMARGTIAYYCDNDWARALSEYRQAEVGLPNDAQLQAQFGYTYRRLGNWQEAVNHLERVLTLSPRDLYDAEIIAQFYRELRRYDRARDLSIRCVELAPRELRALEILDRTQFAIDGDLSAYLRAFEARPLAGNGPTEPRAAYQRAMLAHDYAAAERALSDPRLKGVDPQDGLSSVVFEEPVALHRSLVAFLTNQRELTQRFAEAAIADYRQRTWNARQRLYVELGIALAKAFLGQGDEAVREAEATTDRALIADQYGGRAGIFFLSRIYVVLDRRDEALSTLKRYVDGLAQVTPNEIRVDPLWSRLKDDPRFEEILKSAKPL
jgi:TolB-like protein